jgi:hypothetical protein
MKRSIKTLTLILLLISIWQVQARAELLTLVNSADSPYVARCYVETVDDEIGWKQLYARRSLYNTDGIAIRPRPDGDKIAEMCEFTLLNGRSVHLESPSRSEGEEAVRFRITLQVLKSNEAMSYRNDEFVTVKVLEFLIETPGFYKLRIEYANNCIRVSTCYDVSGGRENDMIQIDYPGNIFPAEPVRDPSVAAFNIGRFALGEIEKGVDLVAECKEADLRRKKNAHEKFLEESAGETEAEKAARTKRMEEVD